MIPLPSLSFDVGPLNTSKR